MNKKKIIKLNNEKLRDLYLRDLSLGTLQGPPTGYPSIDKPWLKFYTPNDILTDIDESSNIYEYMYKCNKSNLDRIAINYYGRTYTYKELIININNVANKFRALGIKENDVISICMPSTPETIFSILIGVSLLPTSIPWSINSPASWASVIRLCILNLSISSEVKLIGIVFPSL